jgi:hypothetical protein
MRLRTLRKAGLNRWCLLDDIKNRRLIQRATLPPLAPEVTGFMKKRYPQLRWLPLYRSCQLSKAGDQPPQTPAVRAAEVTTLSISTSGLL